MFNKLQEYFKVSFDYLKYRYGTPTSRHCFLCDREVWVSYDGFIEEKTGLVVCADCKPKAVAMKKAGLLRD